MIPVEAFLDDRLSKTELRVLGAILSFVDKKTGMCWPKREQIAERCGLSLPKISTATSSLVGLGWLQKEGDGGRSRSTNYKVLTPVLIPKTVPDSGTVPKTETVPYSGTKTVPDSGTGIKQTIEQTKLTTTSARPKKLKVIKNPKAKITRDWQPGDRCLELIARAGIDSGFISGLIDEFILYWEERGDKRTGWDATFVNHAKTQWERHEQKSQRNRAGFNSGFNENSRGNYDTKNSNNEAYRGTSRKMSLAEQAERDIEIIEQRDQLRKERSVN
jgi:hypothetical protein